MNPARILRDVRYAGRMLVRNPGFTLIALLTFAVGIGVNTAVFSVFNGVLLRPLPYPEPDRITMMWLDNRPQAIKEDIGSYPNYRDWREQNTTFAHVAAFTGVVVHADRLRRTGADPGRADDRELSRRHRAEAGRSAGSTPRRTRKPATTRSSLLSHGLWQRKFGGAARRRSARPSC